MTNLRLLAFAVIALTPSFAIKEPDANVRILAVTPTGKLLTPITILEFKPLNNPKTNYAKQFKNESADHIPMGQYSVTAHADDREVFAIVTVNRPHTLLVINSGPTLIADPSPLAKPTPRGRILGIQGKGPVWVKLVHAFAEDSCCTIHPVLENGDFLFDGPFEGDYLLLVLHDSDILFERLIHLEPLKSSITVDLEKHMVEFH